MSGKQEGAIPIVQVDVDKIRVPQERITSVFDPEILEELVESIKVKGILQPLLCLEVNGEIWLIDGLHRLQAAKQIGLKTVPCLIKKGEEADLYIENLIANRMRGRSNPAQEALLIRKMKDDFGWPWKEIAKRLGMSLVTVKMYYDVAFLPEQVLDLIKHGKLAISKAYLLRNIPDPRDQVKLAEMIVNYGYSETQCKALVEEYFRALQEVPAVSRPVLEKPEAESYMHCEICDKPMKEKATYHWICDECWNLITRAIAEAAAEEEMEKEEKKAT
jgi:ParB family chromosome partitioning protein